MEKGACQHDLFADWTDKLFAVQRPHRKARIKRKQYDEIDVNKCFRLQEMEYDE